MQETQNKVFARLTATPQEKQSNDLMERLQKDVDGASRITSNQAKARPRVHGFAIQRP